MSGEAKARSDADSYTSPSSASSSAGNDDSVHHEPPAESRAPAGGASPAGSEASFDAARACGSRGGSRAGTVGQASVELAAMVRPGSGGAPATAQEIWERVVDGDAELPGHWVTTADGAMDAARVGDWALCAYLAARCFRDGGGAASLAAPDERCQRTLWLEAVAPIVVEVPRGLERLCVRFEGSGEELEWVPTSQLGDAVSVQDYVWVQGRGRAVLAHGPQGSAEHFNAGRPVELSQMQWRRSSKLRRLVLGDEDCLELRRLFAASSPSSGSGARGRGCSGGRLPRFMRQQVPLSPVPGVWFHVLAYPLAGDPTKALLRPMERGWKPRQREAAAGAVRWLGETLVSQCAKANQWDLVATFLRAGVPCPDLSREFDDVCGGFGPVQRHWQRDLLAAAGSRPSLLELAAAAASTLGTGSAASPPLRSVLDALRAHHQSQSLARLNLASGPGSFAKRRPPLIVAVAGAERWDMVKLILEEPEDTLVSAASLLQSPVAARAPLEIIGLAESRAEWEELGEARAPTLLEYFRRLFHGEMMGDEAVPSAFRLEDGTLEGPASLQVLASALRLGGTDAPGPGAEVVFVAVSSEELAEARVAIEEASCTILPIDVNGRAASLKDPDSARAAGACWLAVLCPVGYCRRGQRGGLFLEVPVNCIPTPYFTRTARVRVTVVTPCCGKPLQDIPVHLAGRRVGVTGGDGALELALPPGRHVLRAAGSAIGEEVLEVGPDDAGSAPLPVTISASGELFVFLQDNSFDDDMKDSVMLCANRSSIPDDVSQFVGTASAPACHLPPTNSGHRAIQPVLCVPAGIRCSELLPQLAVRPTDPREYRPNADLTWFEDFADDCQVAMLANGTPIRLGDLIGPPAQGPGGAGGAAEDDVASAPPFWPPSQGAAAAGGHCRPWQTHDARHWSSTTGSVPRWQSHTHLTASRRAGRMGSASCGRRPRPVMPPFH